MSAQPPSEVEEYCQVQIKATSGNWLSVTNALDLEKALKFYDSYKGGTYPARIVRVHVRITPFESTEWK